MSSRLAIGAVSAVLRNLLDDAMINVNPDLGTTVDVSAVAPDTIDLENDQAAPRLNLFLYQVTPNSGWRNAALPSRNGVGDRLTNVPLALDLHYLVTAYGRSDFHAEILLGYAMHVLHERPWLDRASIREALNPGGSLDLSMFPPAIQALSRSDLADQVEAIKIVPEALGTDELSKLWSAIKSDYRPSAAYRVSVVLIEAARPDVLVKGADYSEDQVVGGDLVKSWGGEVKLAQLVDGYSTTAAIARINRGKSSKEQA